MTATTGWSGSSFPGSIPERDVELTVLDGILHIRARHEDRAEHDDDDTGYRTEFRYGEFVRNVMLPPVVSEHRHPRDVQGRHPRDPDSCR